MFLALHHVTLTDYLSPVYGICDALNSLDRFEDLVVLTRMVIDLAPSMEFMANFFEKLEIDLTMLTWVTSYP